MSETIKIKCPICGVVLTLKKSPGIESKNVTCPVCKTSSKFTNYKMPIEKPIAVDDSGATEIGGGFGNADNNDSNDNKFIIGKLQLSGMYANSYPLELGTNIIGRKTKKSTANVQVDVAGDKTMSRMHSMIEVVKGNNGYIHYFSNAENKNSTSVNNQKVEAGDKLILNSGDLIKMGNIIMKFVISE